MRRLIACLIVVFSVSVVVPTVAFAQDDDGGKKEKKDKKKELSSQELMEGYFRSEQFILSRISFAELSADPVKELIVLAKGKKYKAKINSRAILSLALYASDDRARKALKSLFKTTKHGKKTFDDVLIAYAQAFGEEGVPEIAKLLKVKKPKVREAAVTVLGQYGGQPGYDKLREHLESENNKRVRATIEKYTN